MSKFDYDFFVIGGGSGGVRAGRLVAGMGKKVGIAEEYRWGGTCVIRGCVPKKLMVYASQFSEEFEAAGGFGWTVGDAVFDWKVSLEEMTWSGSRNHSLDPSFTATMRSLESSTGLREMVMGVGRGTLRVYWRELSDPDWTKPAC